MGRFFPTVSKIMKNPSNQLQLGTTSPVVSCVNTLRLKLRLRWRVVTLQPADYWFNAESFIWTSLSLSWLTCTIYSSCDPQGVTSWGCSESGWKLNPDSEVSFNDLGMSSNSTSRTLPISSYNLCAILVRWLGTEVLHNPFFSKRCHCRWNLVNGSHPP